MAAELWKRCGGEFLIGGRDLAKGKAIAGEFDGRVSAAQVDVLEAGSLEEFCGRCSVIVNCAGPVMALQDRVAQAAWRARCHYIDAAGMSVVKERMLANGREMEESGLSFVVSAGWNPGLSEVLPVYAEAQARGKMETIESVSVYQADSGEWSTSALRDAVWFVRQTGLQSPGYFQKGEWTRVKLSEAGRQVDLGEPVGRRRFSLYSTPELREVGRRLKDCDVFTYAYVSGLRTILVVTLMALVPLPEGWSVGMFRNVFRRNRLPVDGFVVAQVVGWAQGRRMAMTYQIVYRERRDYWMHGVALATVARMAAEGRGLRSGVHFLAEAVEPAAFMEELRKAGVEVTERVEA